MDASFCAINAIVNEAADATADRVAVNAATIVNEAVESPPSPTRQRVSSEHEQIITTQKRNTKRGCVVRLSG
jgi:hypothetical protein